MMIKTLAIASATAFLLLSGCSAPDERDENARVSAASSHETAIRSIDDRWLGLIRNRDAAAIAHLYAPDGALMPPGAELAEGRDSIEKAWRDMMQTPGFGLTFAPEKIIVASAGDMALDRGTYRFTSTGPSGPTTEAGKYVVVWRVVGGEWKVAADIFNSDGAQPAE